MTNESSDSNDEDRQLEKAAVAQTPDEDPRDNKNGNQTEED